MVEINGYDIALTRGDSLYMRVDLSGRDLPEGTDAVFTVKKNIYSDEVLIRKRFDASDEVLNILLTPAQTNLEPGTYVWDVRLQIPLETGGYEVYTPMEYASFAVLAAVGEDIGVDGDPGMNPDLPALQLVIDQAMEAVNAANAAAQTASAAAGAASAAARQAPCIGDNGNWFLWNSDRGIYEDSGTPAAGDAALNQQLYARLLVIENTAEIVPEAEGSVIAIGDSRQRPLRGLTLYGKTEQSGAQLATAGESGVITLMAEGVNCVQPSLSAASGHNGVTLTPEAGNIRLDGALSASAWLNIGDAYLQAGREYVLSGNAAVALCIWDSTVGKDLYVYKKNTDRVAFVPENTGLHRVVFCSASGAVFDGVTVDMMIVPAGYDQGWQPYVRKTLALPTYRNLVSLSDMEEGGLNTSTGANADGAEHSRSAGYIAVEPGTSYTFTYKDEANDDRYPFVYFYTAAKTFIDRGRNGQVRTLTVTTPENCCYVRLALDYCARSVLQGVQFCRTDEIGLPGIAVADGGSHTDEDGRQWLCDEIDLERGVRIQRCTRQRIQTVTLLDTNGAGLARGLVQNVPEALHTPDAMTLPTMLCDAAEVIAPDAQWAAGGSTVIAGTGGGIVVTVEGVGDLTALNTWLAENEINIVYALQQPLEYALAQEAIAAYRAMTIPAPGATIRSDAGCDMLIRYVADNRLYFAGMEEAANA